MVVYRTSDMEHVVHCSDCINARELEDDNTPYQHREGAIGWYCAAWNQYLYNCRLHTAEAYFCADGSRRD